MRRLIHKFFLVIQTVWYLKPVQLIFQTRQKFFKDENINNIPIQEFQINTDFAFTEVQSVEESWLGQSRFRFLNLTVDFGNSIEWNYNGHGALWRYNLNYFHFLFQKEHDESEKIALIRNYYRYSAENCIILEPYPVSLRTLNILKFISNLRTISISSLTDILENVQREYRYLRNNFEFHLLGNHLLENAFSLIYGGGAFGNNEWISYSKKILLRELDEQILGDGGHFELSPMYHKIIFFRVLEFIDWYGKYEERDNEFYDFCMQKASKMLDWMENIKFNNGDIPLFNDAAKDIAFDTNFLKKYAEELGVQRRFISLSDSGYRSIKKKNYEMKIDVGQIGASYQPGHAHADALSFILYRFKKPLFVEQGTSTYENGSRRDLERSTESHNTVVVAGKNQSEVWGGFRVGKRALTTIIRDGEENLVASHDGYKDFGVIHNRKFEFRENEILLEDSLGANKNDAKAYFHLYPGYLPKIDADVVKVSEDVYCSFEFASSIDIERYNYADTYNQYKEAYRLVVSFDEILRTTIKFQED